MKYLLVLHKALDDSLVDEINATGAYLSKNMAAFMYYVESQCSVIDGLCIRLNDNFCQVGYDTYEFYHSSAGSHLISGYTEINLDQLLELLGIKESEPFEDELMQLLGG